MALISALVLAPPGAAKPPQVLFDDFNYGGFDQSFQLWHHGWTIRTAPGWPGVRGAAWSRAGISFVGDPANRGNRFLRLTSSTDGTPAGVDQAEICQRRKFFDGTYATRVRFSDGPVSGPDGDQLVETFYAISPLRARLDPKYSELQYYPDVPMSIAYNLWFIQGGQLPAGSVRRYHEDVDWVYYQVGAVLSPQQVTAEVANLRRGRVVFRDTVPPPNPPLDLPCNIRRG